MEAFIFCVAICLAILQILITIKFFQIASDVRKIRTDRATDESFNDIKQRIALEKYLGHFDQVRELVIRNWVRVKKAQQCGTGTLAIDEMSMYLHTELKSLGIDSAELDHLIFADSRSQTPYKYSVGDFVIEKATGQQWKVAGTFRNQLFCVTDDGANESRFTTDMVMPLPNDNQ